MSTNDIIARASYAFVGFMVGYVCARLIQDKDSDDNNRYDKIYRDLESSNFCPHGTMLDIDMKDGDYVSDDLDDLMKFYKKADKTKYQKLNEMKSKYFINSR